MGGGILRLLKWVFYLAIAAGIAAGAWWLSGAGASTGVKVIKDEKQLGQLAKIEMLEPYRDDYEIVHAAGRVANLSNKDLEYAKIKISVKDEKGATKNAVQIKVNGIPKGSLKSFDAQIGVFEVDQPRLTPDVTLIEVAYAR